MDFKHTEVTGQIIGAAMKIHRTLGNGFQEVVYQRCLEIEFNSMKLNFEREKYQGIYYCGVAVERRRVDFLVEDKILVKIKAKVELDRIHLAQAINYLEAFRLDVGLLLNFGSPSLQYRRLHGKKSYSP